MARLRDLPRALRSLAPSVLGSMAASVVGVVAVRAFVPASVLMPSNDVTGTYLQTLGTIYAVLLAFVVFMVWTEFSDVRSAVEHEANELSDLVRTAAGLPPELSESVRAAARRYLEIVLGIEWEAMTRSSKTAFEHGWSAMEALWAALRAHEAGTEGVRALCNQLLERFDDLSDARAARISRAGMRVPVPLQVLLWAGALSVVGSMGLFGVESFALHSIMTASMAGAISHVLFVVRDLDNPFDGEWRVSREPFERVSRMLAAAVDSA